MFSKYTRRQMQYGLSLARELPEEQRKSLTKEGLKDLIEEGIVEHSKRIRTYMEDRRIRQEMEEVKQARRENSRLAKLALDLQKLGVTINPSPEVLEYLKQYY